MHDAARAIQFLKTKSKEWNIDPDRIILKGNSAGGATTFYLNYHADLRDSHGSAVDQQSTKVLASIVNSGQASIDPDVIK